MSAAEAAAGGAAAGGGAETYTGTTFAIEEEDHTLANSLRFFLNKNPHVGFCGYSIPHPTEHVVNLRVQTTGEITAAQAVRTACADLKQVCNHIDGVFAAAVEEFKATAPQPMETGR